MSRGGLGGSFDIVRAIPEILVDCAEVLEIIDNFQRN
jgi:hypothetical protein